VYSTCLAIQNLWLAARVEGLGVGWISILEPSFVAESFGLPEGVIPVAYLALGRPIEFPREPLLERVGWREREKLEQLVFRERFGEPFGMSPLSTKDASEPDRMRSDPEVRDRAEERLDALTKPKGSLGRLEELALQLCAVQGTEFPRVDRRVLLLFAGDHGVAEEGVSAYRTEITARMVYQFVAGGAAVNALARRTGLPLRIIDVGVDHDFESAKGVRHAKVRRGTRNMRRESAMTESETRAALEAGAAAVRAEDNLEVVALGEMGIANTTPAAALICALLELDPTEVVGRGTGVGEKTLQTKRDVVRDALALHAATSTEPLELLARLGGYEIAALVGAILEAASRRVLVVLDGFIVGAAALVAHRLRPEVLPHLVAGHVGGELGHRVVLESLGLHPLLDLDLRLGEGSGAVMALDLVDAAARILGEMDTFEEAGIERPDRPEGLR
ncbi:MAG: nicotinate-nucleotide--dimethylbenzimidazole phosphoribosyltransferase, partial [Planctomycetota bacterium]